MRATGNGDALVCVNNLIAMRKMECPMSRGKGIDGRLIDRPANNMEEIDEEVTDLIEEYEPRLQGSEAEIEMAEEGDFKISISATMEGDEDVF